MIQFYRSNKSFESKKSFRSYFNSSTLPEQSVFVVKQLFHPAQQGRQLIRTTCLLLLLAFSQWCQAQTPPPDGLYTFQSATRNGDGTFTSADGFFLILGNNGSSAAGASNNVSADIFGAYIADAATTTSGTSYLEVKVKNGGSFQIVSSVIGDYDAGGGSSIGNDFFNVYASGWANGVEIARTPAHTSTGEFESNYNLNFSAFAGKTIDAFRVYYSWSGGTEQDYFNLQDMTIAGASSAPPSTLPLTWLSFTAKEQDKAVALNWSTAVEQNTKDFVVQHSANGGNWNTIGTVRAAGNSSTVQTYSFLHRLPVSGVNYYRLLQRDIDERKSYSKVVTVDFDGRGQVLMVYPNPVVNGLLTVKLEREARVQVYNGAGAVVLQKQLPAGVHQLSLQQLSKGLYRIKAGAETEAFVID